MFLESESPTLRRFFYITKISRQKFRYLENEKSFQDEIKSIFHFERTFIEGNKKKFFGR